jgi:hypothetical protein
LPTTRHYSLSVSIRQFCASEAFSGNIRGVSCAKPEPPATREQLELLREHRPLLQYSQEPYRMCSARTIVDTEGNALRRPDGSTVRAGGGLSLDSLSDGADPAEHLVATGYSETQPPRLQADPAYANRVYGRVVDDGRGGVWLQYWFWIYLNQKRLLGFGSHEGDWEMIQIHLGRNGEPDRVTFAQHEHGDARRWGPERGMRLQHADGHERIVVFVAPFSHASYYSTGTKFYAGGTDSPDELGPLELPDVEPFGAWASWPGRWGGTRTRSGTSPPGPACQGSKWSNPDRHHALQRSVKLWQRALKGLWIAGHLTYPRQPRITARIDGTVVHGTFEKRGLIRRGRHLYVSAHSVSDRTLVGGPRIEKYAGGSGRFELELGGAVDRCLVHATAYNRFRQTSETATVEAVRAQG